MLFASMPPQFGGPVHADQSTLRHFERLIAEYDRSSPCKLCKGTGKLPLFSHMVACDCVRQHAQNF